MFAQYRTATSTCRGCAQVCGWEALVVMHGSHTSQYTSGSILPTVFFLGCFFWLFVIFLSNQSCMGLTDAMLVAMHIPFLIHTCQHCIGTDVSWDSMMQQHHASLPNYLEYLECMNAKQKLRLLKVCMQPVAKTSLTLFVSHVSMTVKETKQSKKRRKDYLLRHQFNEKPSIRPSQHNCHHVMRQAVSMKHDVPFHATN